MIPLAAIREAAGRIAGQVHRTPLMSAASLGQRAGVVLHLKCENFQKTGSFKVRGALNKILCLDPAERSRGLVTVSAGNHAQAVAWAAARAGTACVVVMPSDAPRPKVEAVRGYGGQIIFHADHASLFDRVREVEKETGYTFIHPFDDPAVLAGAGTVGLEIIEDFPGVEALIVPVGGGGLMGGVACAVKRLNPTIRVIAVELAQGPGLGPALAAGRPVPVTRPAGTVADGLTPPFVGELPLRIARELVDQLVTVREESLREAMGLLLSRAKLVAEGGGAATAAALLEGSAQLPAGTRTVAIVSGGNANLQDFRSLPG